MDCAEISAYSLPDGSKIERVQQMDGTCKWAVRHLGNCMSKSGEWEWEPMPSGRDDDFLATFRFDSAEEAYLAWEKS